MEELKEKPLSILFFDVNKLFLERIKEKTNKLGINPSYRFVFMILNKHQEGVTQKQICEIIHYKPSSISLLLQQMENEGLISRIKADLDNRKTIVCMTEKGKKLDDKIKQIFIETEELIVSSLEKEELDSLKDKLLTISNVLKDGVGNV